MLVNRTQLRIAAEAARIIATEGQTHYGTAKRKAAARLNSKSRNLPSNQQVEDALREYQLIYGGDHHQALQIELLEAAIDAMQFFSAFKPRLTGTVLEGTADRFSRINLHLFTDNHDEVIHYLMQYSIVFEQQQRRIRWQQNRYRQHDFIQFEKHGQDFELAVFSFRDPVPPCPVTGKPQRREKQQFVKQLLDRYRLNEQLSALNHQ